MWEDVVVLMVVVVLLAVAVVMVGRQGVGGSSSSDNGGGGDACKNATITCTPLLAWSHLESSPYVCNSSYFCKQIVGRESQSLLCDTNNGLTISQPLPAQ